jgi:DNA-binding LacI/PurR family transcriptional regulator
MGKRHATLLDIGKALGISPGTVHRALHDNPGVSPMTKAKVLQTCARNRSERECSATHRRNGRRRRLRRMSREKIARKNISPK